MVAGWFALLSELGRHTPETLRTYASALRRQHVDDALAAGVASEPNPLDDPLVQHTLTGARKILAGRRVAVALANPAPIPGVRLQQLSMDRAAFLPAGATPDQRMLWAATRLAIDGMLRPNEFLGSKNAGRGPLEVNQIRFFTAEDRPISVEEGGRVAAPSYFTLQLGQAKNDQFARKPAKFLRDGETVSAMWRWMNERLDLGAGDSPFVFSYPGVKLSGVVLKARLREHFPGFTLKSLRRGGTAERVAANVPIAEIARHGGWASGEAMVRRYAGAASFQERAVRAAHEREILLSSSSARPPAAAASSSQGW